MGADADLALVDLRQEFTVEKQDLFYRHRQSPYLGRKAARPGGANGSARADDI